MGLFSKKEEPDAAEDAPLSPAEGVAGVAICAMYADGVLAAEEADELAAYLARMDLFRGMSDRDIQFAFQRVEKVARAGGDDALLSASANAIPERLRPTAFLVAADLIMTDGAIGSDERAFLENVKRQLAVTDETAVKIIDVLAMKHVA